MRLPWLTFGVLSIFAGYFLAFRLVLCPIVEDALDGEDDFGKVGAGPAGETRNKRFNH